MSDATVHYFHIAKTGRDHAAIDLSASGDTTILTGVAGEKIVVYSMFVIAGAAVTLTVQTGTTAIIGALPIAANGGFSVSSDHGICETEDGDALTINLSGSVAVGGVLTYARVDA